MAVRSETELIQEIERLRAELTRREQESADKERQLERYAADLRETFEERALMARHPVIGDEIIHGIEFLGDAALVVRSHHERWDGPDEVFERIGAEIR